MKSDCIAANSLGAALRHSDSGSAPSDVVPSSEIAILSRSPHLNGLLIGPQVAAGALEWLIPRLDRVVTEWDPRVNADVPSAEDGTVIIWHVEALDARAQRQLLEFVDRRCPEVQIISVATSELYERVQRGEFLDVLYYRLNVIQLAYAEQII